MSLLSRCAVDNGFEEESAPEYSQITGEQEDWLKDRLETLVRTVRKIDEGRRVQADERTQKASIDGAINGTAEEIILMLRLEPKYENLRRTNMSKLERNS